MKICAPAKFYLVLSVLSIIIGIIYKVKTALVVWKIVFAALYTWILSIMCKKRLSELAWAIVLLPFIAIGSSLMYSSIREGMVDSIENSIENELIEDNLTGTTILYRPSNERYINILKTNIESLKSLLKQNNITLTPNQQHVIDCLSTPSIKNDPNAKKCSFMLYEILPELASILNRLVTKGGGDCTTIKSLALIHGLIQEIQVQAQKIYPQLAGLPYTLNSNSILKCIDNNPTLSVANPPKIAYI